MNFSGVSVQRNIRKLPEIRFSKNKRLTSYAGLVIFQALLTRLGFVAALKNSLGHLTKGAYGQPAIVLLLIVHLLLGFRRLRGLDYYRDDPLVLRVMGLKRLPDVSTVSRKLRSMDTKGVENLLGLNRALVLGRLNAIAAPRVTMDFDGVVQSTKGHTEGTAIGFNKKKKGARSYYPLFCTVAQTDQVFDMHHRSGNVHDSNGAVEFIDDSLSKVKETLNRVQLEVRVDSAFFNDDILWLLELYHAEFTCSVPFERFAELKAMVEKRKRWKRLDNSWSYFVTDWQPKCWDERYRFLFLRQKKQVRYKGPLQLDLYRPKDFDYDYKVIVTNKKSKAKSVLQFHNGRGVQEKLFGEGQQHTALGVIPTRRKIANQTFTIASMLAHNLSRELQMAADLPALRQTAKRNSLWKFLSLGTIRQRLLHRAGSLSRPAGKLTLTVSGSQIVQTEMERYLQPNI